MCEQLEAPVTETEPAIVEAEPEFDDAAFDAIDENDYEEITSDEVDRVVTALEKLMDTVQSTNIKNALEDAASTVHYLFYDPLPEDICEEFDPDEFF